MKYTIISGSHRKKSNSMKTAKYVSSVLNKQKGVTSVKIIDIAESPLPLWQENRDEVAHIWNPVAKDLSESSGLVVISPEWGGMVPSGLKNFFLYCTNEIVGHKPCLLLSISSGRSGSYPIAELRSSSYKNNRICYIPDHVIVRNADHVLNDFENISSEDDRLIKERIQYSCKILNEYSKAFLTIRKSNVVDFEKFPNGM